MRQRYLTAVAVALVLPGCTGGAAGPPPTASDSPSRTQAVSPDLAPYYNQEIDWRECGSFQCGSIEVPLDYQNPSGRAITIEVLRRPANDGRDRVGSLLVNPGGPGVSGINYARNSEFLFNEPLLDHYDIVGWDPRGVGMSTSVECLSDEQTDEYLAADGTPDSAAEVKELIKLQRFFTSTCQENSGRLLSHIGTFNSARDMDVLRSALGEGRADYFGASYGTELGATYAELFPERVGRMVLDGALDPSVSSRQLAVGQLRGFQRATAAFIEDCVNRDSCSVGPTAGEAEQQIIELLDSADAQPLPTNSGRVLTESLATTGMVAAMYDQGSGWPALRIALQSAREGDGSVLLALADSYSERQADGSYASNVNDAFPAISCTDRPDSASLADVQADIARFQQISPIFGETFAWAGTACADWPVAEGEFPRELKAKGSAPILVVGTTRDPATPYEWSIGLADQLDSGVLLSRDGDGHTGYTSGNSCIDQAVERYLLNGEVPKDGTTC